MLFVNDSKATNADAAEKALLSFRDIFWILGGKAEGGRHRAAASAVSARAQGLSDRRGERDFARTLDGAVAFERCGTLDRAVAAAARDAAASERRGAGRAAVAGLRLLRPVPQFRGARRSPLRAARLRASSRVSEASRTVTQKVAPQHCHFARAAALSPVADWMRTRRSLAARRVRRPDVDRRRHGAGGEPRRRRTHRPRPFHFVNRQTELLLPSAVMLAATSFLSPRHARRAALDALSWSRSR